MIDGAELEDRLRAKSARWDMEDLWPHESLELLSEGGILEWGIPEEYGGQSRTASEFAAMYCDLSDACLLTTFILTQRNGAVQRIVASENAELRAKYLPLLANGELFTTVGISHLSTSGQHLKNPAVRATQVEGGYLLEGTAPWITGGLKADVIITGGTLSSGEQILALIPTADSNVSFGDAIPLMALTASLTGSVELNRVFVPESHLVAGPIENVMRSGGGGTGSTTTSALGIGVSQRVIRGMRTEANKRADLEEVTALLEAELLHLQNDLRAIFSPENLIESTGQSSGMKSQVESLRHRANSLVLRATQSWLAATKGAGFVRGHAAERSVREAMFFLVWSCPQNVVSASLREFACSIG